MGVIANVQILAINFFQTLPLFALERHRSAWLFLLAFDKLVHSFSLGGGVLVHGSWVH